MNPRFNFNKNWLKRIHELFIFFQIQVSLKEQINSFTGKYSKELSEKLKRILLEMEAVSSIGVIMQILYLDESYYIILILILEFYPYGQPVVQVFNFIMEITFLVGNWATLKTKGTLNHLNHQAWQLLNLESSSRKRKTHYKKSAK